MGTGFIPGSLLIPRPACPDCGCDDPSLHMGHIERGVYDGVLWWECLSCGHAWPRGGFEGHRAVVAQRCVDEHNDAQP